jgi:hypothetical protein
VFFHTSDLSVLVFVFGFLPAQVHEDSGTSARKIVVQGGAGCVVAGFNAMPPNFLLRR